MEFCVDGIEGPTVGRERGNVAFNAPNIVDVMPDFGIVAATPPFARNSGQTFEDHESILRLLDIDEAGFTKGRRVKNLIPYSDDLVNGDNAAAPGTIITSANTITFGSQSNSRIEERTYTSGQDDNIERVFSLEISASDTASVGKEVTIGVKDGASPYSQNGGYSHTLTLTPTRITTTAAKLTPGQTGFFSLIRCDEVTEVKITVGKLQLEEVDGKANKAPSEYIPTTTAAVSKFFNTTNGNTVLNNVVIENEGTLITGITGRLSEEGSQNVCFQSKDFSTTWTALNSAVITNTIAGPNGVIEADTLDENAANTTHQLFSNSFAKPASIQTWTGSIYAKANENDKVALRVTSANGSKYGSVIFDLAAGTVGPIINATWGSTIGRITALANGWYRCEATVKTDALAEGLRLQPFLINSTNNFSYLGIVGNGVYLWGAQLENKPAATSPIETTTGSVSRSATDLQYDSGNAAVNDISYYLEWTPRPETANGNIKHLHHFGIDAISEFSCHVTGTNLYCRKKNASGLFDSRVTGFTPVAGTTYKVAGRMSSVDGLASFLDGVKGSITNSDTSDLPSVPSSIAIGARTNGDRHNNSDIKNIKIWNEAKSDAFLQALTS